MWTRLLRPNTATTTTTTTTTTSTTTQTDGLPSDPLPLVAAVGGTVAMVTPIVILMKKR